MVVVRILRLAGLMLILSPAPLAKAQQTAGQAGQPGQGGQALPEIPQLIREVREHQKQLEKARENYTYTSLQTTQDLDANGQVTKTETAEYEEFFVNGRPIGRLVKKDGKPLDDHEQQKETERVTKLVEKAEKPEQEQPKEGQQISLSHVLLVADVRNPRRVSYRGRPTIVFDFVGRRDLKAHGLSEDLSKKLQGTVWIEPQSGNVVKLAASNDSGMDELGIRSMNTEILYIPVTLHNPEASYWMPASAVIDVETAHRHWRNVHNFSTYKRFQTSMRAESLPENR